jgi:hypothetical protein
MKLNFQKYLFILILILGFIINKFSYSQKLDEHTYRLIISSSMFQNAKSEDVEASTKILAAELKKESKVKAKFDISVCKTLNEIVENIKTTFDMLYISPVEYLQLKKKFALEPSLISEIDNNYGDVYYLITYKIENKKSIKDLQNGVINILSNADDQPSTLWLDKLLRDNKLPVKEKFFKQIILDYKTNNVLLPVYFKKVMAAIVTKPAYELICELNPKIKQETEIIQSSEPMVRALFCFDSRNKNTERKEFLLDYMQKLHKSNYGKQVLSIYLVNKLIPFKQEYLDNILYLYK